MQRKMIPVNVKLHKQVKIEAAKMGVSVTALTESALKEYLTKKK